jgi:hypothetical protein
MLIHKLSRILKFAVLTSPEAALTSTVKPDVRQTDELPRRSSLRKTLHALNELAAIIPIRTPTLTKKRKV